MRALALLLVLAGCPRGVSSEDRAALQDFRTVERDCLARAEVLARDFRIRLSDSSDFTRRVKTELVDPWTAMRARFTTAKVAFDEDLTRTFERYFDERTLAWADLARAAGAMYEANPTKNYAAEWRSQTAAADADKTKIDAAIAGYKLAPIPPYVAPPIIELQPPPPAAPGAAFFLVDHRVVILDDTGFRTIATDIDTMDVLQDGTMWACSEAHVAHWDGTKITDYKPTLPVDACAAGPDGELWVIDDDRDEKGKDRLARFDGKTWKIFPPASVGDPYNVVAALVVGRDRHVYAVNRGANGGSEALFVFDKTWKPVALQKTENENGNIDVDMHHAFLGNDGEVYAVYQVYIDKRYSNGLARVTATSGGEPMFVDDNFQARTFYPFVDAAGVYTVLQPSDNVLEQAKQTRQLPMPAARDQHDEDNTGPFWFDGSGRVWVDLLDGLNVLEQGGKRTVFARGSIDVIREPVTKIVVVGGGPKAVPGPVAMRTITGSLEKGGKLDLVMCEDPGYDPPCAEGVPRWTTSSDGDGNFTFENVPRWKYKLEAWTGTSGSRYWRELNFDCCAGEKTKIPPATFPPGPIY